MSAAAAGAAAAVAAAERDWREAIAYFEERGALAPDTAIALPTEPQLSKRAIGDLLEHGDLSDTGAGTYWLDLERALARRERINRSAGRLLAILGAIALIAAAAAMAVLGLR
jgi:hypothetical protein